VIFPERFLGCGVEYFVGNNELNEIRRKLCGRIVLRCRDVARNVSTNITNTNITNTNITNTNSMNDFLRCMIAL